jgi:hypothetical protein
MNASRSDTEAAPSHADGHFTVPTERGLPDPVDAALLSHVHLPSLEVRKSEFPCFAQLEPFSDLLVSSAVFP